MNLFNFMQILQRKSDRIYTYNGKQFQLTKNIVDRLLYFNKSPNSKNDPNIDRRFVELLLVSIFNVENLKQNRFDKDLLKLTKCEKKLHRNDHTKSTE